MRSRLNTKFLDRSSETLKAIAHPVRISIIDLLHSKSILNVTDIYKKLAIEQAVASHHLRILKDRGVVSSKREGKNTMYSLTASEFINIIQALQLIKVQSLR